MIYSPCSSQLSSFGPVFDVSVPRSLNVQLKRSVRSCVMLQSSGAMISCPKSQNHGSVMSYSDIKSVVGFSVTTPKGLYYTASPYHVGYTSETSDFLTRIAAEPFKQQIVNGDVGVGQTATCPLEREVLLRRRQRHLSVEPLPHCVLRWRRQRQLPFRFLVLVHHAQTTVVLSVDVEAEAQTLRLAVVATRKARRCDAHVLVLINIPC